MGNVIVAITYYEWIILKLLSHQGASNK
jgi:hypothetical protein